LRRNQKKGQPSGAPAVEEELAMVEEPEVEELEELEVVE
jgi:hypothetical protein